MFLQRKPFSQSNCEFGFCWFAYLVASGLNLHRNTTELILLLSKATFNGDKELSISFAASVSCNALYFSRGGCSSLCSSQYL
ncbi:hypothetical protein P8452_61018 [Trifolium repens]|nr:hypothetical protein P8452_03465 [Trifolium repens]WJX29928.1 hypothetical protein P8452_18520 [Trifolium repens]WJX33281.1 hypothetical protein P8452_21500 [Trifolium repens]WJX43677.1 hypothetical protein P8452_30744 [Trifolium repens]WJX77740.1 hypothetical protein P8452_61018 [Trifolium repens]